MGGTGSREGASARCRHSSDYSLRGPALCPGKSYHAISVLVRECEGGRRIGGGRIHPLGDDRQVVKGNWHRIPGHRTQQNPRRRNTECANLARFGSEKKEYSQ
jgi:hypothetical protein